METKMKTEKEIEKRLSDYTKKYREASEDEKGEILTRVSELQWVTGLTDVLDKMDLEEGEP